MDQGRGQRSFQRGLKTKVVLWASPFVLLLAGQMAWSQVETGQNAIVTSVTGASAWTSNTATSNPIIYGGVAGDYSSCTQDGTTACNNCTGTTPCNANRIYPNLQLSVSAEITAGLAQGYNFAFLVAQVNGGATYQIINGATGEGQQVLSQNQTVTFSMTWEQLCQALGVYNGNGASDPTDCTESQSAYNLYLVIQPNSSSFQGTLTGTYEEIQVYVLAPTDTGPMNPCLTTSSSTTDQWGICNFFANAGDSEVYIENPAPNITCPGNTGATGISGVRVFYVPDDGSQNFQTITYASPHQDFQVDGSCNPVGDWTVTGLTNGQGYFFLTSVLDAANNNSLLLDNSAGSILFSTPSPPGCAATGPYTPSEWYNCLLYSVPGKVAGLLPGGVSCFIATAAYGSPFQPIVKLLRTWRDQFLLPYSYGRDFVHFYYRHSPYFAMRIRESPVLKHITQVALLPLWGVAWLMLKYGAIGTLLIIVSSILLIIYLARESRA